MYGGGFRACGGGFDVITLAGFETLRGFKEFEVVEFGTLRGLVFN
jgi:hypothetical protein